MSEVHSQPTHLRGTLTARVRMTQSGTHLRSTYQNGSQVTQFRGTLTARVRSTQSAYTSKRYSDSTCQNANLSTHLRGTLAANVRRTQTSYTSQGYSDYTYQKDTLRYTSQNSCFRFIYFFNTSLDMSEIHFQAIHIRPFLTGRMFVRRTYFGQFDEL